MVRRREDDVLPSTLPTYAYALDIFPAPVDIQLTGYAQNL